MGTIYRIVNHARRERLDVDSKAEHLAASVGPLLVRLLIYQAWSSDDVDVQKDCWDDLDATDSYAPLDPTTFLGELDGEPCPHVVPRDLTCGADGCPRCRPVSAG